VWQVCR